jgi:hypothetical protein
MRYALSSRAALFWRPRDLGATCRTSRVVCGAINRTLVAHPHSLVPSWPTTLTFAIINLYLALMEIPHG